jgi:hypothetical protein
MWHCIGPVFKGQAVSWLLSNSYSHPTAADVTTLVWSNSTGSQELQIPCSSCRKFGSIWVVQFYETTTNSQIFFAERTATPGTAKTSTGSQRKSTSSWRHNSLRIQNLTRRTRAQFTARFFVFVFCIFISNQQTSIHRFLWANVLSRMAVILEDIQRCFLSVSHQMSNVVWVVLLLDKDIFQQRKNVLPGLVW